MVKARRTCTCANACDPTRMPAPLHRDWYGQRRTDSAHCWALIWSPISSLAHSGTMMGRPACPVCPCPSPTPLRPPLTSSPRDDPPSVCRSPDQQPRQYTFHHTGPQCLFHKLSQALGLKGCMSTALACVNTLIPVAENSLLLCHRPVADSFASTGCQYQRSSWGSRAGQHVCVTHLTKPLWLWRYSTAIIQSWHYLPQQSEW